MMKKYNTKNIICIIFIICTFITLILPLIHLDKRIISEEETRRLATLPYVYNKKTKLINTEYGQDFENFLKDRFYGRLQLIHLNGSVYYYLSNRFVKIHSKLIDKKEKFMYDHLAVKVYNQNSVKKIGKEFEKFNKFCNDQGIKLYIYIIPQKEIIYRHTLLKQNNNNKIKKGMADIDKYYNVNFICPIDKFLEAKETIPYMLFYKTDPHGTLDGSFVSYQTIMQKIQKDYPNVKVAKYSDFNYSYSKKIIAEKNRRLSYGATCNLTGMNHNICKEFHNVNYRYYKLKNIHNLKITKNNNPKIERTDYFYPDGTDLKLMIMGDSSMENLMDIIPYSFKNIAKIRLNSPKVSYLEQYKIAKTYNKEIKNYKPDIIILYVAYTNLGKLYNNINTKY